MQQRGIISRSHSAGQERIFQKLHVYKEMWADFHCLDCDCAGTNAWNIGGKEGEKSW